MANIHIKPPEDLEDDMNLNINNLHATVTNMAQQLNYVLGNIDDDNVTEEFLESLNSSESGE